MKRLKNGSSQDENWVMAIILVIAMTVGAAIILVCINDNSGIIESISAGVITAMMTFAVLMGLVTAIIQCVNSLKKK